jgi:hypothetical protein
MGVEASRAIKVEKLATQFASAMAYRERGLIEEQDYSSRSVVSTRSFGYASLPEDPTEFSQLKLT